VVENVPLPGCIRLLLEGALIWLAVTAPTARANSVGPAGHESKTDNICIAWALCASLIESILRDGSTRKPAGPTSQARKTALIWAGNSFSLGCTSMLDKEYIFGDAAQHTVCDTTPVRDCRKVVWGNDVNTVPPLQDFPSTLKVLTYHMYYFHPKTTHKFGMSTIELAVKSPKVTFPTSKVTFA
jgi:hypothetical protein